VFCPVGGGFRRGGPYPSLGRRGLRRAKIPRRGRLTSPRGCCSGSCPEERDSGRWPSTAGQEAPHCVPPPEPGRGRSGPRRRGMGSGLASL